MKKAILILSLILCIFCYAEAHNNSSERIYNGSPSVGATVINGTPGSILFVDPLGLLGQDNSNFYWNDTNNLMGIGTNNPSAKLDFGNEASVMDTAVDIWKTGYNDNWRIRLQQIWDGGVDHYLIVGHGVSGTRTNPTQVGGNYYPTMGLRWTNNPQGMHVVTSTDTSAGINIEPRVTFKPSGNVGIGTNNPTVALYVVGDTTVTQTMTASTFNALNGVTFEDGTITGVHTPTGKWHQSSTFTIPASAWTDVFFSTEIADETQGSAFTFDLVSSSDVITVNESGMYQYGGCVHYQNNTGGSATISVGSRILVNSVESRCSQRYESNQVINGGEGSMNYLGTAYINATEQVKLQVWSNRADTDFISTDIFDVQTAATLWLIKIDKD